MRTKKTLMRDEDGWRLIRQVEGITLKHHCYFTWTDGSGEIVRAWKGAHVVDTDKMECMGCKKKAPDDMQTLYILHEVL
jgi:hypothetical protein